MNYQWQILPKAPQNFLARFPEINPIIAQLLYNRQLTQQEEIDVFLSPDWARDIFDPFLFKQMPLAVERVMAAITRRERVMIYGDYDADGICSTAILFLTLKNLGVKVDIYIPFRETEGYGLNLKAAREIIDQKFDLVITVDCGVSNVAEIELLNQSKIDVIVLDHHQEPSQLPPALAIINPALNNSGYPFSRLAGAGVAFKFIQALIIELEKNNRPIRLPLGYDKWLLDLVAIATIGDVVPLLSENRVLVKYGLLVLEKTKRLGLNKILMNIKNGKKIDPQFVSWRLVPRLNAAGRIDHASIAFNLIISEDENETSRLAALLEKNNSERQQATERILKEAVNQIGEVKEEQKIIWAVDDHWSLGMIGLVAGRLKDKYYRPVFIISKDRENYVGSCRSIDGFNVARALRDCHDLLVKYGGHAKAAGFTVKAENLEIFKDKVTALALQDLKDVELQPTLPIEAEIKLAAIDWRFWEDLERFEPFGEGNPKPRFAASGLKIEQLQFVGSDGQHLRVMVSQNGLNNFHKLIGFSLGEWHGKLKIGDQIDLVFELDINQWNGHQELQLKIIDLKLSH